MASIKILDPVVQPPRASGVLAPPLEDVTGKAVGFRIQWSSFEIFMERFEELLTEKYHPRAVAKLDWNRSLGSQVKGDKIVVGATGRAAQGTPEEMDRWTKQIDWAVLGLAA